MMLTYPERVTAHNIEKLRAAVRNGLDQHPGANLVTLKNEDRRLFLKVSETLREKFAKKLQIGDIVERHLVDNECVIVRPIGSSG
jgi:DNA-directed RNA polymerase III subunit RPC1